MGKECSKCRRIKENCDFSKSSKNIDGFAYWCRQCHSEYYAENKQRISEKQKQKYINAMQSQEARDLHRARNSASRIKNREAARAAVAAWKKRNRALASTYERNRRAASKGSDGKHCHNEIMRLMESSGGLCYYCRDPFGEYHVDHMTPLCRGGSNSLDNLAISCVKCNLQKGAKTAEEFKVWRQNWVKS